MKEFQIKYYEMKQKYDEMNEKMQFLSKVIFYLENSPIDLI